MIRAHRTEVSIKIMSEKALSESRRITGTFLICAQRTVELNADYRCGRKPERFDEYTAEIRNKWGDDVV